MVPVMVLYKLSHRPLYLGQTDSVQTIPIIGQFCNNKEVSICSKTGLSKGGKILNVPYLTYLMVFNIVYINSTHKGMVCTSKSIRDTVVYAYIQQESFFILRTRTKNVVNV